MDEQRLKDQEQILDAVVSVSEILNYIEQDRFLTLKEAAAYTSMSKRTLRDLGVPCYRVSLKLLLFKKSELDEWLSQFREGGKDELDELINSTLEKVL